MKIIVAHKSPDLDALGAAWFLKTFLPGWHDAKIELVPAGEKLPGHYEETGGVVEKVDGNQVIHVDTGLGPLDHHQTSDDTVSAASLALDYALSQAKTKDEMHTTKKEALQRMAKVIVAHDHFKEVFYPDASADYHEFNLYAILEGLQFEFPQEEEKYMNIVFQCLDALLHNFENRVWAEHEIEEKGIPFETKYGKGIGIETTNDTVLKLTQKMGYVIAVRKDPFNGKIRIKALPDVSTSSDQSLKTSIDLTPVYEILKQKDPEATWFLHVSKKMLLNGSSKNPTMKGSKLSLKEVIDVLKSL